MMRYYGGWMTQFGIFGLWLVIDSRMIEAERYFRDKRKAETASV